MVFQNFIYNAAIYEKFCKAVDVTSLTGNEIRKLEMAAMGSGRGTMDTQNQVQSDNVDRLKLLYPNVNEDETPLPRSWSTKDKFSYIGLSQNNLRVHYKGKLQGLFMD